MKRILALILTGVMLVFSLSSCTVYYSLFGIDENYTGPLVHAYLSDLPTTFDPLYAYLDDSAAFIMSLIYEGLYKYDVNGKVVPGLSTGYEKTLWNNTTGEFQIEIGIKKTMWNDQTSVSADDFVYAWRRILDPGTSSAAAVLLYDIKNAMKVANAQDNMTKFDLGANAVGTNVLRIDFETEKLEDGTYKEPDLDNFLEKLASPMLVPIRSDAVAKLTDWGSTNATVLSSGPFYLKSFSPSGLIRLERNRYYLRDQELDPIDKYVKPYGIVITTAASDVDENGKPINVHDSAAARALEEYKAGSVQYLSYIPLANRSEYADKVTLYDSAFTQAYCFNTENELFAKPEVRKALSLAIDREALAKSLIFAKPATSIVSDKAFETGYSKKADTFNSHTTMSISSSANLEEAKKLLQSAGVTGGNFEITVKAGDENSKAGAEYCKQAWAQLGFKVMIRELAAYSYEENFYDGIVDTFNECYKANGKDFALDMTGKSKYSGTKTEFKGYDVIAVDVYQNSTDAFTVLAPYSKYFSGGSIDLSTAQGDYEPVLPITGYDSEAYNNAINAAFKASTAAERAQHLHEAETILMNDLPVMPLYTTQIPVTYISDLKNITYGYAGEPVFTNLKYKNYVETEE